MAGAMLYLCLAPKTGVQVVIFPRFDLHLVLSAWEKYRVKNAFIFPTIAVLLSKTDMTKYDLSAVQVVECGSAPLGMEVEEIMRQKFGVPVLQVWLVF
jgi:acyl-coenzyme A synthetase/AMP-(fatty) acid ligase